VKKRSVPPYSQWDGEQSAQITYATHRAGIFWNILGYITGSFLGVNVGIHIPAPWVVSSTMVMKNTSG